MSRLPLVPFFRPTGQERPGGKFAVHLALGGARADRPPGDQVGHILRRDDVQVFGAGRHTHAVQVQQQFAREPQALINVKGVVQVGVVDQPLPADRGARFFKIHAHDQQQIVAVLFAQRQQFARVFQRGLGIVNGARPDHHQHAIVVEFQNFVDFAPCACGSLHRIRAHRQLRDQLGRVDDAVDGGDAQIVGARQGNRSWLGHAGFRVLAGRGILRHLRAFWRHSRASPRCPANPPPIRYNSL